jgi:hypothetical protein
MIDTQAGKYVQMIESQLLADAATVAGVVDCRGWDYATLVINFETEETTGATANTVAIQEGLTTDATNFTTAVANVAHDLETGHLHVSHVDLRGKERYLRVVFSNGAGAGNELGIGCVGILSRGEEAPANTTYMISPTHGTVQIL